MQKQSAVCGTLEWLSFLFFHSPLLSCMVLCCKGSYNSLAKEHFDRNVSDLWNITQFRTYGFVEFTQKLYLSIDISVGMFYNKDNWNGMDLRSDSVQRFRQHFSEYGRPARNTGSTVCN